MEADRLRQFEETCLPFLPDCYAFALSLTRRGPDAEDLVQDTFVKAQRAFGSFQQGTNAKAWLFTILRRLHIDNYRRKRLRPVPLPEDELIEMGTPGGAPELDSALPWDALPPEAVREAIDGVPEPFHLPVRLRDLDGLSYREIGEILAIPAGTVMSRLHRGREYVRDALVTRVQAAGSGSRSPDRTAMRPERPPHQSPLQEDVP
jgi:RNA polymerase sigma-70 factor (ECF subfamily)